MAMKKGMEMQMCESHMWCRAFGAVVAVALGLLLIWPVHPWFTFQNTVGLLVILHGLKKLFHLGKHCC
jgi:uncharacterized membrane protein HdeD (DUF308 family)